MLIPAGLATLWVAFATQSACGLPTWPSPIDELEDLMFLNTGYNAREFSAGVTPCSFSKNGKTRIASAEWLRTAFHDMSTGNVFLGIGGLDASLVFEVGGNGGENLGPAFNNTFETFTPFFSSRASMADIIALGVYTAVRSCGGPIVKIRGGRIDATSRGPTGVPQPQNSLGIFTNQFERVGFNVSEMIAVTACGHTIGGVHGTEFPEIVALNTVPEDFQEFDSTTVFDEKVASDYIKGSRENPLAGALAKKNTRDSDTKVYEADNNVTITALADPATFQSTCARVLEKMIDVVPSEVKLTDPIEPYEIKPVHLQLSLAGNGSTISFSGGVRVRTTSRSASDIKSVKLLFKDRLGSSGCKPCEISTEYKGEANGFDDSFAFYEFSTTLPVDTSISGFNVQVTSNSGETKVYDNNGSGYPVQDTIMLQPKQSCIDGAGKLTVVAAIRDTVTSPKVTLSLTMKTARSCCVVPALKAETINMTVQDTIGPYTFYSGSYSVDAAQKATTKFDISVSGGEKTLSDSFKSSSDLGPTCTPFGSGDPDPSEFSYEGCFTDSVTERAFTGAAFADDEMTIDDCAKRCKSYQFFGLEYGRECYCGNTRNPKSTLVAESECTMVCGGDESKICGALNRLSAYNNTAWIPTTNPKIPGYDYVGCHNDSTSSRALSGRFEFNAEMTVERCASFCKDEPYFGVEYSSECFCGAGLSSSSTKQPEADCSFLCSGNNTQYCGGSERINVYVKET